MRRCGRRSLAVVAFGGVGDEHPPGGVGEGERRGGFGDRDLRGHPARPEHGHVAGLEDGRVAEVGGVEVADPEGRRVADAEWLETLPDNPGEFLRLRLEAEQKRRIAMGLATGEEGDPW